MGEYVLGISEYELQRLGLQHDVWGPVTRRFLDAVAPPRGGVCLDAGCGPGYVVADLVDLVGPEGQVDALDEAPRFTAHVRAQAERRGWGGVRTLEGRLEDVALEPQRYDLVLLRWVLSFVPDPGALVAKLAAALRPGGALLVQDYNHEGVSVFPDSAGFRAVIRATRELYAGVGGDTWIAGRVPGLFRAAGLEPVHYDSTVLSGDRTSGVFRWLDAFFPHHAPQFHERGLLTTDELATFEREWAERAADPDAVFFSPIVAAMAARKPSER